MDLLTAVEQIVEKAQGSGLSSEFYRKAARPIKYVAEKMDLTREQSDGVVNKTFIRMMEELGYDVELTYVERTER